ncbi:MAG: hypothetical protein ACK4UR_06635, partial [Caldimicrobium sp.]
MNKFFVIYTFLGSFLLLFFYSHAEERRLCEQVIYDIETCEKIKMEIKPAVCSRCFLKYEENKLYILPTQTCPS